jgi:hypothetical protein
MWNGIGSIPSYELKELFLVLFEKVTLKEEKKLLKLTRC